MRFFYEKFAKYKIFIVYLQKILKIIPGIYLLFTYQLPVIYLSTTY